MSRLLTAGFESQRLSNAAGTSGERNVFSSGTVAIDTEAPRSGAACAKCGPSAANFISGSLTTSLGHSYFYRAALKASAVPAVGANLNIMQATSASGTVFQITLGTSGSINLFCNIAAKTLFETGFKPEAGKWYLYEVKTFMPAAGEGKVKLIIRNNDGAVVYESEEKEVNVGTTAINGIAVGHITSTETAVTVSVDDVVVNSDEGENQNGFPGNGKFVLLKPVEDVSRVGMVAGAGGTTELYKAVASRPPVGKKSSEATNASQIGSANSNTTDNYVCKCAAYSTPVSEGGGGIGEGDVIKLIFPQSRIGQSSATSRNVATALVSNPAGSEPSSNAIAGEAGADPTNWQTLSTTGGLIYNPVIVKGTKPELKVRKGTATTDNVMIDMMGIGVEYVPAPINLSPGAGASGASLALKTESQVIPSAGAGSSGASLALSAKTAISPGSAQGQAGASLGLKAPALLPGLSSHCYLGADMDGDVALMESEAIRGDAPYSSTTYNRFEEHIGRSVAIVHFSDPWNSPSAEVRPGLTWDGFGAGASAAVKARGAVPMKSIGGPANVIQEVNEGKYDAYFETYGEKIAEFAWPVILRPWWEFNGTWWNWGRNHSTAAEFKTAWQRMVTKIRSKCSNVSFYYCANVVFDTESTKAVEERYPGDAYVDWVGYDGYVSTNPLKNQGWMTALARFQPTYNKMVEVAPTKPHMIGEVGASETGGNKAEWIQELLTKTVPRDLPKIKAVVWFNDNIVVEKEERIDWPIESSESAKSAFRDSVADQNFYIGGGKTYGSEQLPVPGELSMVGIGTSLASLKLGRGQTLALSPGAGKGSAQATLRVGKVRNKVAVKGGLVPPEVSLYLKSPTGRYTRWAPDEPDAANIISGLVLSDEMPGGWKTLEGVLGRNPQRRFADVMPFSEVKAMIPGRQIVWEGFLDKTPDVSGEHSSVTPQGLGWQAVLEDDQALQIGFINSDQSGLEEPSAGRRKSLLEATIKLLASVSSGFKDASTIGPGIIFDFSGVESLAAGQKESGEQVWNGGGNNIGEVHFDFVNLNSALGKDAATTMRAVLSLDDMLSIVDGVPRYDLGENFQQVSHEHSILEATGSRKYLVLQVRFEGAYEGNMTNMLMFAHIVILGDQGLQLIGTWPEVGLDSADMLIHLINNYAQPLRATEESVESEHFPITQAWYPPQPTSAIAKDIMKYEPLDWFVYKGKLFERRRSGGYGRFWRSTVESMNLNEQGEDSQRLWRSITVQWNDAGNGQTRTAAPPGRPGAYVEAPGLEITDPQHPAVLAERTRNDILVIDGVATEATAIEIGERFLEEAQLLSTSGSATLSDYVMDSYGIMRPVIQVKSGDYIAPVNASDPGYRKIINKSYNADNKQTEIDLDAPASGLEELLERLNAALVPLGLS